MVRRLAVGAALAALVAFPLYELATEVARFGFGEAWRALGDEQLRSPIVNTLWTALASTVLVLAAATGMAFVIERGPARWRMLLRFGVLLPLLVPPFVSALSWIQAYQAGGWLDDATGVSLPWITGPLGVVAAIAVSTLPLAYIIVAPAVASTAERELELAARLAGARPAMAFRTVTLPRLRRPLTAAGALVFVMAANAFGVPVVLGTPGGFATATTRLYQELALSAAPASFGRVVVLAAFLVVVSFVVVGLGDAYAGASRRPGHRVEPAGAPVHGAPRRRVGAGLVAGYALVATVVPFLALVVSSLVRAPGLAPTPDNLTLSHLGAALSGSTVPLRNSVALAVGAATVALVLGALVVGLERRRGFEPAGTAVTLTFAVPGSALAVAVLLAYGPLLRDTLLLILVAYLAKFWSLGHRPLRAAIGRTDPDLVGAARVSGASPRTALRTVLVPLLWPAVAGAWGLVFLFALHELTMSALLYGPGSETLAVVVLNLRQLGDASTTNALAVLLTLGVLLPAAALGWALRGTLRRWIAW